MTMCLLNIDDKIWSSFSSRVPRDMKLELGIQYILIDYILNDPNKTMFKPEDITKNNNRWKEEWSKVKGEKSATKS